MKLKSTVIKNYRGIKEETLVSFQDFNCIVSNMVTKILGIFSKYLNCLSSFRFSISGFAESQE